jgi:hypothetical protein
MTLTSTPAKKVPVTAILISVFSLAALGAGLFYLNRPAPQTEQAGEASAEAKAYLPNLQLSDVNMQATENFMNQQVVEIQGKIANRGTRKLALVEVYCLFYGVDGKELYRERLPMIRTLAPNETRPFRLPFDNLPGGWNQAMPRLAIARITFAR